MRVVFVDNLLFEQYDGIYEFDLQPHLGLLSLIALIEQAGHDGELYNPKHALASGELTLDETLYRRMAREIVSRDPDVVGFTTLGCNFICTVKVAAHVRRLAPRVPLLVGGPHASILAGETLERWPQFDAVVRGEAEPTIIAILDAALAGDFSAVPGVTYRGDGGNIVSNPPPPLMTDLDTLPWPAYDRHPIEQLGLDTLRVEAGRGCPFSCTFCSTASFFGRRYRLKSADRLCQELDFLNERYGVSDFALTHDLFTVNKAKVREFCLAVRDRGYTWSCSARMDCVNPALLDEMSAAGCRGIYYGVETGSPRMQEVVRKRLDLSLFFPTLEHTHTLGMRATASFITGYPEEEREDQDETLDLIGRCFLSGPDDLMVQLHLLTPEPGTRLANEYAGALEYDGHVTDFNFPTLEPDDADAMRLDPEVFVNHHYYRSRLPRERHILVTSLFPSLRKLGFPMMRHLLSRYERRLSVFVARVEEWARAQGERGPYDSDFLCRFMDAAWGRDHELASLVRYIVAADRLRPPAGAPSPSSGARPAAASTLADRTPRPPVAASAAAAPASSNGGPAPPTAALAPAASGTPGDLYVLSSAAVTLRDLPDCAAMLAAVEARAPIPGAAEARRAHYLLLLDDGDAPVAERRIRNFEIGDALLELIEAFTDPTPMADGAPDPEAREQVEALVRLGALTKVRPGGSHAPVALGTCEAGGGE